MKCQFINFREILNSCYVKFINIIQKPEKPEIIEVIEKTPGLFFDSKVKLILKFDNHDN